MNVERGERRRKVLRVHHGGGRGEGRYRGCIMEGGEEKEGIEGASWRGERRRKV